MRNIHPSLKKRLQLFSQVLACPQHKETAWSTSQIRIFLLLQYSSTERDWNSYIRHHFFSSSSSVPWCKLKQAPEQKLTDGTTIAALNTAHASGNWLMSGIKRKRITAIKNTDAPRATRNRKEAVTMLVTPASFAAVLLGCKSVETSLHWEFILFRSFLKCGDCCRDDLRGGSNWDK